MNTFIEALNWRYATKKYDPTKKLSDEQLNTLLEALRLAPSSFGLQPWEFIVVTNPEVREKLQAAAWGQTPIVDSSHLIVLAAKTNLSDETADEYIASVAKTRGVDVESLKGYADMIKGSIENKTPEQRTEWASRQAYIALGVLLSAAASIQVDSTPMEGFDPAQFNEILGLNEKNLTAVVLAATGFRSSEDEAAQYKKARFDRSEVVIEVK